MPGSSRLRESILGVIRSQPKGDMHIFAPPAGIQPLALSDLLLPAHSPDSGPSQLQQSILQVLVLDGIRAIRVSAPVNALPESVSEPLCTRTRPCSSLLNQLCDGCSTLPSAVTLGFGLWLHRLSHLLIRLFARESNVDGVRVGNPDDRRRNTIRNLGKK